MTAWWTGIGAKVVEVEELVMVAAVVEEDDEEVIV